MKLKERLVLKDIFILRNRLANLVQFHHTYVKMILQGLIK